MKKNSKLPQTNWFPCHFLFVALGVSIGENLTDSPATCPSYSLAPCFSPPPCRHTCLPPSPHRHLISSFFLAWVLLPLFAQALAPPPPCLFRGWRVRDRHRLGHQAPDLDWPIDTLLLEQHGLAGCCESCHTSDTASTSWTYLPSKTTSVRRAHHWWIGRWPPSSPSLLNLASSSPEPMPVSCPCPH